MTASEQAVAEYLDRLYECGKSLTRTQIEELMADVREHVAAAVVEAGRDDEATVRTVLDRLGTPEDIVAAAAAETPDAPPAAPAPSPTASAGKWTWRELTAVVFLVPGAFLAPVVAPLAGMAFAWSSEIWDKRAKRVAYWIGGVGAALPLLLVALGMSLFLPIRSEVHTLLTQNPVMVEGNLVPAGAAGMAVIPSVDGMTEDEATQTLWSAGFQVVKRYEKSDSVALGDIIKIDPVAGATQSIGTNVRMVISIG